MMQIRTMRAGLMIAAALVLWYDAPGDARAQDAICAPAAETALEAAAENCATLGRSSACYGAGTVAADFAAGAGESLAAPGDQGALLTLTRIETAALDFDTGAYSVAVVNAQADLPASADDPRALMLLLLGEVNLENAVDPADAAVPTDPVRVVVTGTARVNLRGGPSRADLVVASAAPGDILLVDGRDAAGDWLRVTPPEGETAVIAWVSEALVAAAPEDTDELAALPEVSAGGPDGALTPLARLQVTTGLSLSGCIETPDLVVLAGPEGATATVTINGVALALTGTAAVFSAESTLGDLLAFGVLEDQLSTLTLPDTTRCLHTRLAVIEGEAALDGVRAPLGHLAEWATCLGDDATAPDAPLFVSEVEPPLRLARDQLAFFGVVEGLSEALLGRALRLPNDGDIELALAGPTATRPAATSAPRPTTAGATAAPRPSATPGSGDPAPTAVPPTPPPSGSDPDCSTFRATSPFGVVSGAQPFFWDGARNVTAYQLAIIPIINGEPGAQQLFRTGANNTTLTVDIPSTFPGAGGIRWYVQALVGGEPNFTAVCETPAFDNPVE